MRLTADQVKQGILHPERFVRDVALRYFSESYSPDSTVMPVAIRAIETYGWEDAFEFCSQVKSLVQTEATLDWFVSHMERLGNPDTVRKKELCLRLSAIITAGDPILLAKQKARIQSLHGLYPTHRHILADRLRLVDLDPDICWKQLEAWCERSKAERFINKVDIGQATRLVEAIARGGEKFADRVLAILSQEIADYAGDNPMAWMEGLMAMLAGGLRLEAAAPLLAAKLREDLGDLMNEECMYSLTKIGTEAAVDAIFAGWADAPWHYKLYASSALEYLHTDGKVAKCLEFFPREDKSDIRSKLMRAALNSFAPDGIEPARQMIAREGGDFYTELMAVATLAGVSFPELDQWRAAEEEEAKLRQEQREEKEERRQRQSLSEPPSAVDYPTEPPRPTPIIAKDKVGRNDPCPCGSGKKYKKCCLGKK